MKLSVTIEANNEQEAYLLSKSVAAMCLPDDMKDNVEHVGGIEPAAVPDVPVVAVPEAVTATAVAAPVSVPEATNVNGAPIAAPTQPVAEAPAGDDFAGVEFGNVDKSGLPYDPKIHVKAKSKKVDGNWKNSRGLDKAFLAQREAALRAQLGTTAPAAAPAPTIPGASVAAAAAEPENLLLKLQTLAEQGMSNSTITIEQLQGIYAAHNVTNIIEIQNNNDVLNSMINHVQAAINASAS